MLLPWPPLYLNKVGSGKFEKGGSEWGVRYETKKGDTLVFVSAPSPFPRKSVSSLAKIGTPPTVLTGVVCTLFFAIRGTRCQVKHHYLVFRHSRHEVLAAEVTNARAPRAVQSGQALAYLNQGKRRAQLAVVIVIVFTVKTRPRFD